MLFHFTLVKIHDKLIFTKVFPSNKFKLTLPYLVFILRNRRKKYYEKSNEEME